MKRDKPRRKRLSRLECKMGLTVMIDIVFLLLVFFVITMKPRPVLAELITAAGPAQGCTTEPPDIRIDVLPNRYLMNGKIVNQVEMDRHLRHLARFSTNQVVVVSSHDEAAHYRLITALDLCTKSGFSQLSLARRR